ncbi:hypothetical protein L3X38_018686 [Prunus dulcis]|uniref:Uncharacterized protein n=1 Tax=Prunus dulcis TaxID=3755 RepID=A0AAD4ZBC9_PRUDU|nr:hypothetical protein L3X38_018686 [Prunus dulcis]
MLEKSLKFDSRSAVGSCVIGGTMTVHLKNKLTHTASLETSGESSCAAAPDHILRDFHQTVLSDHFRSAVLTVAAEFDPSLPLLSVRLERERERERG